MEATIKLHWNWRSFRKLAFFGLSFFLLTPDSLHAQNTFTRGVNLTNWFQTSSAKEIQFSRYSRKDLVNIKSLGCDVIRLPINLHAMTSGSPDYIIDPVFFSFLDSAVNWAEDLHINLILDNHTFDPNVNTDPGVGDILVKVWAQMATHYKDRSSLILYEILNEPHGLTTQVWGAIQQRAINAIRAIDVKHSIIVGAADYNTYTEMANLPVYTDTNLIYTFHFYDPFVFTHQGASWVSPSMVPLSGVPFPYNSATVPACPTSLIGSWVESLLNSYSTDGTVSHVQSLISIATNFKNTRKVPVYCGEFGVYNLNSNNSDRVVWYQAVRTYLEANGIPWTSWDYQDGFGLFKKGTGEFFEHDLNTPLLQALGLNVPAQTTYFQRPDSAGFSIYSDFISSYINESNWENNASIDYYNNMHPNNGNYCLAWNGGNQYGYIGFDFAPDRDLSKLVQENYAIDFFVRGDSPGAQFDIYFIDTKTNDPNDHPWRMYKQINESYGPWDKKWHHVRIPLHNFAEMGSWDNNQWYNPQGLFDWKAVDIFDIVADYGDLTGADFWFDNILISNIDSSRVWDNTVLNISLIENNPTIGIINLFPNPVVDNLSVQYVQLRSGDVIIKITDFLGRQLLKEEIKNQDAGNHYYYWSRSNFNSSDFAPGIYLFSIAMPGLANISRSFIIQSRG
jgi:endoglucanase